MTTREQVMEDVLMLLKKVSDDWEYTGEITPETRFFTERASAQFSFVVEDGVVTSMILHQGGDQVGEKIR